MDPRQAVILVRPQDGGDHEDRTNAILSVHREGTSTVIRYKNAPDKPFPYADACGNAIWLPLVDTVAVDNGVVVLLKGAKVSGATEVRYFSSGEKTMVRIFRRTKNDKERYDLCLPQDIRILPSVLREPGPADAMAHWRSIVSLLGSEERQPLEYAYNRLDAVDPASALARYLEAGLGPSHPAPAVPIGVGPEETGTAERGPIEPPEVIAPFNSNLSQHAALRHALSSPVCIIEGPPGTGKTETILNIIANIIRTPGRSVGVVSLTNAAVDNVREKLESSGLGFVAADLGHSRKRKAYFAAQPQTVRRIEEFLSEPLPPAPAEGEIGEIDARLDRLLETDRDLARDRDELSALVLERRHFALMTEHNRIPDLGSLPLLRKSSDRILDYLVESGNAPSDEVLPRRIIRRIRDYFRYGPTKGIDPGDCDVLLAVERAWYEARLTEVRARIDAAESELARSDFQALRRRRTELSEAALRHALHVRYGSRRPRVFEERTYRRRDTFPDFIEQHPVILSTCHSLRSSVRDGFLLDYLIIDEASQVGLLPAVLALSCARHVVVVGDLKQLDKILDEVPEDCVVPPPLPAYDARDHNLLSSMLQVFGESVPRTMLREHYRCDPAIIGFCNAMFYDGLLIPMRSGADLPDDEPLHLVRLSEGAHMRHHREGGNSNEREAETIIRQVLPALPEEQRNDEHTVVITPYRKQVDKVSRAIAEWTGAGLEEADAAPQPADAPGGEVRADTVHRVQGRQKDTVILSCVVDDSRAGHRATPFADDARMVNVAVSRAVNRFIMVIDHSFLPRSKYMRRLAGWIRYHRPDGREYVNSKVVSVFDLLYREYSDRLRDLHGRVTRRSRFYSENIMWALLDDILAEEKYTRLRLSGQVLLKEVLGPAAELTERELAYIRRRSSFDFVVSDAVTKDNLLAIEVDGFASHENNPEQRARDHLKNAICERNGLNLLRLPTTGSNEETKVRRALDMVLAGERVLDVGSVLGPATGPA